MMTINQRGDDAFTRPLTDRMPGFVPGSLPNRRPISAPIDAHLATAGLSALPSMYHPGPYSPRFSPYLPYSPAAAAMNDPSAAMLYSAAMNPGDANDVWRAGHFHAAAAAGFYDPGMAAHYGYPYGPMGLGEGARRKNATRETTSTLKSWLNEHRKNPYPTKAEKIMLAIVTRMTLTQVSTWFANARRRLKKENKMTWSPRNRLGEDDEDDDEGQVTGGGGSAANDLSSRASSPILIDVDDDKNTSGRFDESMQATSCDHHEPSTHPRVPTSVTDSHRQGPSSLGEMRQRPTTDESDSRMDFMTSPGSDAKNPSDGYSPRYPYPPYHHHHHHHSAAAVSAALNPYAASAQSLVAASRFPGIAPMNGAAAVSSSNISATVSSAAMPAGRLPFPPQSQHHPHHPHHTLHAAAAAASASGAAGPASLLHLHHPSFAQTASLIAASQRPNPALSPQVMQQMMEQQVQIQRYHQMLMNTSPTSMVTSASNPSPAPSDTSAVVTSSAAPVTTPTTTSKPKIWSIADVATSEDKPSSKKSHPDPTQPKMEPKSVPTEHHHPQQQQQQQQADEDAARADGRRWMDQLIQQRNHPHLTQQQLQQLNFGIHQPQLNGLTSTSAAMYHHHPVFAGISSASMRLPNKSLTSGPLYGLAELLSAQQKENGGVSFAVASSISSSLLADKITSHRGQMTSPPTQSSECQQRIGGANEGHPRSASTSSSASTPTSKMVRIMNIKKE